MKVDFLDGRWKQLRGVVKAWRAKLIDIILDKVGYRMEIIYVLGLEYKYARQPAMVEINRRWMEYRARYR